MDLAADMMVHVECRTGHESKLSDLMIAVIERFTRWRSFPLSIRAMNISTQDDPRIRSAAEVIRAATGRNLDIGGFAKEADLSRSHVFRLFQSSIGVPPKVSLNAVRMERAVYAALHDISTWARSANGSDLPILHISHASFGIMPAYVPESLGVCRAWPVDAGALHRSSNETDW
jgi:AraC-like DNA-binding protein